MKKIQHPGSYFRELSFIFLGLNFLEFFVSAFRDTRYAAFLCQDPGWKNWDPG
jgi:hypothetical protein